MLPEPSVSFTTVNCHQTENCPLYIRRMATGKCHFYKNKGCETHRNCGIAADVAFRATENL